MEWLIILLPLISDLFEKCRDDDNVSRAQAIKDNPNIARGRLRKALRRKGHKRHELRKMLNEAMRELESADVDDVSEFLDELEDNWS